MKNYGITFNGFEIKNSWDLRSENYSLLEVIEPANPRQSYTEFIIPKRDGSSKYHDRYENKEITVVIEVRGANPTQSMRLLLESYLQGEGKLIFSKSPNLFYYASIYEEVEKEEMEDGTYRLTIIFDASPFMYELYNDLRDLRTNQAYDLLTENMNGVLTNTAIWHDIKAPTFKELVNMGNHTAKPIIMISGHANRVGIEIGDVAFTYNSLSGEAVYIDTEKMICYTLDGDKKVNRLANLSGKFPTIPPGINSVNIDGYRFDVDIEIRYRNTYKV